MSNLENLVQKILNDSKEKANSIMDDAKKENEEILDLKIKEAKEQKKKLLETATIEAELAKERVVSRAELTARNEKLTAKQEVIDKTFDLAKASLKTLEEDKYNKFLKDTIKKLELNGDEVFIVAENYKSLASKLGIRISDDESVDSGFVIKDKGIILNYNFDSLVDYYREDLETVIASELFIEEE